MAATEYLDRTRGLARAIGKTLVSVGLVSPDGPAPEGGPTLDALLKEARLSLLPLSWIWNTHMARPARILALRQYVLVVAICVGLIAADFMILFGLMWAAMQLCQGTIPGAFDFSVGTDRAAVAIALGCSEFFGKITLVCAALASLCRPAFPTQLREVANEQKT